MKILDVTYPKNLPWYMYHNTAKPLIKICRQHTLFGILLIFNHLRSRLKRCGISKLTEPYVHEQKWVAF